MLINKLGEFGLIKRFQKSLKLDSSVIVGSGDDCAVLKFDQDTYQLFSCDMIIERVDFTRKDNPYLIGRKAIAISISDIAACAGVPRYCLISVGVPKKTNLTFVDKLFKGILDLAKEYKINLVGGDLSRAERLVIDVSILGVVEKKNLVLRSGAKPGDIVFVTGNLGGSIRGKHLKFIPRVKEARFLVKNFKLNSLIDISDGLVQDLGHILEASKTGTIIYEDLVPKSPQARNLNEVLYMGEDFELLFSLSRSEAFRLIRYKSQRKINFPLTQIGEIVDKKLRFILVSKNGKETQLKPKGFRHF
jgi:thiamine-monophosphate kinase